eukprot:gene6749-10914_t
MNRLLFQASKIKFLKQYGTRAKRPSSKYGKELNSKLDHNYEFYLYDQYRKEGTKFNRDHYMVLFENCVSGIKENREEFLKRGETLWKEFQEEYEPSLIEYNLMIQIYCLSYKLDKAIQIWNHTKSLNIESSQQT